MNVKFVLQREENIVGKGENAGYQHFLLSPQSFQKAFSSRSLKLQIDGSLFPLPIAKFYKSLTLSKLTIFSKFVFLLHRLSTHNPLRQEQSVDFLTLSQTTNFRLFQTERVCRRQF